MKGKVSDGQVIDGGELDWSALTRHWRGVGVLACLGNR